MWRGTSKLGVDRGPRSVLLVGEQVAVDVEGGLGRRVPQPGLDDLHRGPGSDERAGEVGAQVVGRGPLSHPRLVPGLGLDDGEGRYLRVRYRAAAAASARFRMDRHGEVERLIRHFRMGRARARPPDRPRRYRGAPLVPARSAMPPAVGRREEHAEQSIENIRRTRSLAAPRSGRHRVSSTILDVALDGRQFEDEVRRVARARWPPGRV